MGVSAIKRASPTGKALVAALRVNIARYVEMTVINSFHVDMIYTKDYLNIYNAATLLFFPYSQAPTSPSTLPLYAQVATGPPGAVNVVGSKPL